MKTMGGKRTGFSAVPTREVWKNRDDTLISAIAASGRQRAALPHREENHGGKHAGIYSICSANRFVLEAGMAQAGRDASLLSIESTSNQVNQFGGYTGQTPAEFAGFVNLTGLRERSFPQDKDLPWAAIILARTYGARKTVLKRHGQGARSGRKVCVCAGYIEDPSGCQHALRRLSRGRPPPPVWRMNW